ncbi:MAG: CD1871A family CXXC motif-containing protein [Eubacterium sp.]
MNKGQKILRAALLVIAVCMIAVGIAGEEFSTVLQKAVRICLECIGIG